MGIDGAYDGLCKVTGIGFIEEKRIEKKSGCFYL